MIEGLRREERLGKEAVIAYYRNGFGVFDLEDCLLKTLSISQESQEKLQKLLEKQKEVRRKKSES